MATNDVTKFICLFHDANRGRAAMQALQGAGFSSDTVTMLGGEADGYNRRSGTTGLEGLGVPDRDLAHLRDGLAKGGVVLSLEAQESRSGDIERIFHKYSADKIDEADLDTRNDYVAPVAAATPTASNVPVLAAEGAVVPVVEEELLVGKREVERGGVRVFKRVVEEPVSESINLHDEHIVIDRRVVDRAVTDADVRAGDQTIELTETSEVPVVSKVARVVEEVRVGVEGSDRTETIKDSVRHTEVDVEPVTETQLPNKSY